MGLFYFTQINQYKTIYHQLTLVKSGFAKWGNFFLNEVIYDLSKVWSMDFFHKKISYSFSNYM